MSEKERIVAWFQQVETREFFALLRVLREKEVELLVQCDWEEKAAAKIRGKIGFIDYLLGLSPVDFFEKE